MNWELVVGLVAIALSLFFGLRNFGTGVRHNLSDIREKLVAIGVTMDKTWDLLSLHFRGQTGTVERHLPNLGKVRVTAESGATETVYVVDIEKPILTQLAVVKLTKMTSFAQKEKEFFGQETKITVFSPSRMRVWLPAIDPELCTGYMTLFLKWLDSEYIARLPQLLSEFEEPILR